MFHVRPFSAPDMAALVAMEKAIFTTEAWSAESLAAHIALPGATALMLVDATDTPIGYSLAQAVLDEAEIFTIGLLPYMRRKGGGKILLQAHLDALRHQAITTVFLHVREGNTPARQLYTNCGGVPVGTRTCYYARPQEDACIYRFDLKMN